MMVKGTGPSGAFEDIAHDPWYKVSDGSRTKRGATGLVTIREMIYS